MRTRPYQALVPLLVIAGVLSVSGCKLLKKRKADAGVSPTTDDPTASGDLDAFNKADITRFPEERRLFNESAFVRVITFARTAPFEGGTIVGVLDPDTLVIKVSNRLGFTLITFNRSAFPGKRFAGWVPDSAFVVPTTATTPTGVPTTGTVTGSGGGTCSMTMRISGFSPSSPTCSFNESVRANSPSTMTFPCGGGSATVRFGSQTFFGTADRSRVTMSSSSISTFQGCQIRTTQTINGSTPVLSYFLQETIVGGSCKNVSTCTARASMTAVQ